MNDHSDQHDHHEAPPPRARRLAAVVAGIAVAALAVAGIDAVAAAANAPASQRPGFGPFGARRPPAVVPGPRVSPVLRPVTSQVSH